MMRSPCLCGDTECHRCYPRWEDSRWEDQDDNYDIPDEEILTQGERDQDELC